MTEEDQKQFKAADEKLKNKTLKKFQPTDIQFIACKVF